MFFGLILLCKKSDVEFFSKLIVKKISLHNRESLHCFQNNLFLSPLIISIFYEKKGLNCRKSGLFSVDPV